MSNTGSGHLTQQSDSAQSSYSSTRKRASPNSGGVRKGSQSTTSIASVGSSFSKLRKLSHPTFNQATESSTSGLSRAEGSESAGPSGVAHPGGSGHEGGLRGELRYLTDFFPDQSPSDRRLTRSQRQLSAPSSPAFSVAETIEDSAPSSNIPSPAPQLSAGREKVRGRKGRGKASTGGDSVRSSGEHSQPGPSSSGRSRTHNNATTGLCNSIARCDVTSNRVFPSAATSSALRHEEGGSRSAPQLNIMPQDEGGIMAAASDVGMAASHEDMMPGGSSSSSSAGASINAVVSTAATHSYSAGGDTHSLDAHTAQIRNMQRSQAVHAASSFLGTLVPRVQHLLGAAHSHPNVRVVTIMEGLRSSNEIRQAEAASELAEMLLLGNEESLPNLPVKDIVHALIALLQKEHNFELMLTAARCISNMLEALPRALPIVIDAVPYLLEKLKRIECIDVAEQSLMALEVMSKRNGKNIMAAGGIAATISHVDFFSVPSQRLAFQVAANCASFVTVNDFAQVRESLADLTQRLLIEDKRCLESICVLFCRLVDNVRGHADKLREVAGQNHALLKNVQQLLLVQPCAVGPNTFQALVRMLRHMAAKCSDLAVALINMDFARTIRFLIIGTEGGDRSLEMVNRPSQQLQELVFLTGELLPRLPSDGVFAIDSVMIRPHASFHEIPPAQWFWRDDANQWQPFNNFDSRVIEMAYSTNENEISLQINGSVYRMDLQRMVQQNHATGNERSIQRRAPQPPQKTKASQPEEDRRLELLRNDASTLNQVVQMLFPILVEIDGSSSGPALRYESLRVMLRMIYPSETTHLKEVLNEVPLAGHVASALASPRSKDLCIVASALQLVHLVLDKLPELYVPLFRREGVAHEVEKLSKIKSDSPVNIPPVRSSPSVIAGAREGSSMMRTRSGLKTRASLASSASEDHPAPKQSSSRSRSSTQPPVGVDTASTSAEGTTRVIVSPSGGRHRRKASPESPISKKESRRKGSSSNFLHSLRLPSFRMPGTSSSHNPHEAASSSASTSANVATSSQAGTSRSRIVFPYGGGAVSNYSTILMHSASTSGHTSFPLSVAPSTSHVSSLNHQQKEKVRQWIRREAEYLLSTHFSPSVGGDSTTASTITRMGAVASALITEKDVGSAPLSELKTIMLENDVSAFELSHSGVLSALIEYLTSTSPSLQPPRKLRLKRFAAVFMSLNPDNLRPLDESGSWAAFEALVTKLLASVAQLEQFQVKVSDMGGILTGSSAGALRGAQALRFFQTHQIRCNLRRHPACRELKEWRHGHGSIKVDPFTSISAIERYLLDRGVGYVRGEDSSGDEDASDDDEMPSEGSLSAQTGPQRRIDILINDEKIPGHMSILQAIRQYSPAMMGDGSDQLAIATGLWVNTHTLYYRAASIPPPPETNNEAVPSKSPATRNERKERKNKIDEKLWIEGEVPVYESPLERYLTGALPVEIDDPCVSSLILLRCLYALNRFWWSLFEDEDVPPTTHAPLLPAASFHSAKLNAKMARQLSDFLSVATQQIPKWTMDLVKAAPFIFTFASRRNLLYCTAFGRDRALMHLVNQADGGHSDGESGRLTPRLERRKVSVRRDDLLRQAEQTMNHLGHSRAMLEVGFEGEAGTGFGPTLEFYSTVSREIQKASLRLWHGRSITMPAENIDSPQVEYTTSEGGLYPAAHGSQNVKQRDARLKKFEFIGRLLAQALIDARMLDLPLNPVFFKWLCGEDKSFGLADLEMFDKTLYQSLRSLALTGAEDFESLEQYFTLPGDESFELVKGGRSRSVDSTNVTQYIKLVAHWELVEGVRREMEAVRRGFESIINISDLSSFTPDEMEELFCGCSEATWTRTWSEAALQTAIKPDHGYSHDSEQIRWLIHMLSSFDYQQQRKFLQFVTGSPKLPVGGFRSLNPPLTVVKKSGGYGNGDEELPSAMTCYNYLKIPAYSSYEVFKQRFDVALRFIYSFHLT
uniref:E3 ubiquitin-protein ligase n=4 Tax=Parascaris TaxID=6254 RepID=A0A914ZIP5_PARUN